MMLKSGIAALIVAVTSMAHAQQAEAPAAKAHEALTFGGDIALWTVAIRPDKTMDFETVMQRGVGEVGEARAPRPGHRLEGHADGEAVA
jgi:hypothetical protein